MTAGVRFASRQSQRRARRKRWGSSEGGNSSARRRGSSRAASARREASAKRQTNAAACGGTQKREDAAIAERAAAHGFTFHRAFSEKDGQGRSRRSAEVTCPAGHRCSVLLENFWARLEMPSKGCSECHHAALGKAKRLDVTSWAAARGIEFLGEYEGLHVPGPWRCVAGGHEFVACVNTLKTRKEGACKRCGLEAFAVRSGLELVSEVDAEKVGPAESLLWRRLACGHEFSASKITLGRASYRECGHCAALARAAAAIAAVEAKAAAAAAEAV